MRRALVAYAGAALTGCAPTLAALAIVTGCTSTPGEDVEPSPSPADSTIITAAPAGPGDVARVGGFGFSYDDGLTVNVLAAAQYVPDPVVHDAGAGRQAYEVDVTVENATGAPVPVDGTAVRVFAGPGRAQAPPIVDPVRTVPLVGNVSPDALVSGAYVFAAPVLDAAEVEVVVGLPGREPVTFVRGG